MQINSEILVANQKDVDGKGYKIVNNRSVPWDSTQEFLDNIPKGLRHEGMLVRVKNIDKIEIWTFVGSALDELVLLSFGGSGGIGPDGKTAYEVAVDNGFVGTATQWLISLIGTPGTPGSPGLNGFDGKSAYQLALSNGFIGTLQQWLDSLKGRDGENATITNTETFIILNESVSTGVGGLDVSKIPPLPQIVSLTGNEDMYVVQGGLDKKLTPNDLAIFINTPHPTYIPPTDSINLTNQTLEFGSSNIRTIVNTFVKNDAGAVISQRILKNNIQVSATNTYNETGTVPLGNTLYKGEATYGQGAIKNNILGNPDPIGRIPAGVISDSKTITGVLPYYWKEFTSLPDLNTLNLSVFNKVVADSNGSVSINMAIYNKYLVILIPATSSIKTKWEITDLNRGDIGPNSLILNPVAKVLTSPQGYWTSQNYNAYVTAYSTNISPKIQLT